jgi:hypothetical protein
MSKLDSDATNQSVVAAVCERRWKSSSVLIEALLQKNLPAVTDSRYSPPKMILSFMILSTSSALIETPLQNGSHRQPLQPPKNLRALCVLCG